MAPSSTYRLQLSAAFTLDDAAALTDYLDALGVGALYASPLLESAPGSTHGYDVVDPTRVSTERGGEAGGFDWSPPCAPAGSASWSTSSRTIGVAVPRLNPWWWDVLRHGRASRYAKYFDIDWDAGPLLLPVLAGEPADEEGELARLRLSADAGELRYYEHVFPVAPGTAVGSIRDVHARQHYRLVSWRRGAAELTYRRFFDVSTLAAVRVEDPEVFAATHGEVLRWVAAGEIDGLRVDHPDGLTVPGEYLQRLRAAVGSSVWLVVEKILAVGEALPASWPVDGTTGYDALREVCGVFVDPAGAGPLTQLAAELTGSRPALSTVTHQTRRLVAGALLAAEVRRVARACITLFERSFPLTSIEDAAAELLASFPTYRSYLPEHRAALEVAVDTARTRRPELASVLDGLYDAVLASPQGRLAARLQQSSGAVMAKGVEDTAFYRWNRFVALNEVGGEPDRFGVPPAEFHAAAAAREAAAPATMTTLSTHDTKRSEDVRARLAVLSELPGAWAEALRRWVGRHPLPEPYLELLAWQNLVGAWPIGAERMRDYLRKASREAKLVTSHLDPVPDVDEVIAAWPSPGARRSGDRRRDRGLRRPDRAARLVELARPEAAAARRAGRAGRVPGHRAVRVLAGRPGQPPPGRLRRPQLVACPA